MPCGAARGATPSGRRRCSTSPACHPENHGWSTVCRTDRYRDGQWSPQDLVVGGRPEQFLGRAAGPASGR